MQDSSAPPKVLAPSADPAIRQIVAVQFSAGGAFVLFCGCGGGGFFLACEDFGRMFDNLSPACALKKK